MTVCSAATAFGTSADVKRVLRTSIDSKCSFRERLAQVTSFLSIESGGLHLAAIVGCTCAVSHEVPRVCVARRSRGAGGPPIGLITRDGQTRQRFGRRLGSVVVHCREQRSVRRQELRFAQKSTCTKVRRDIVTNPRSTPVPSGLRVSPCVAPRGRLSGSGRALAFWPCLRRRSRTAP